MTWAVITLCLVGLGLGFAGVLQECGKPEPSPSRVTELIILCVLNGALAGALLEGVLP